ncbi:MAG: DUF2442 domain-containing protein [bacterium]
MIKIKNVIPEDNFKLKIEFENGLLKIFDMEPYLKYDVFSQLKDINYFYRVQNKSYYIEWPNEQDLSADTLFVEGKMAA